MTLLIDIGNSRLKYCFLDKLDDIKSIDIADIELDTVFFNRLFVKTKKIVVASVNQPSLCQHIETFAKQHDIEFIEVHSQAEQFGVLSGYRQPEKLGIDRWLVILACAQHYANKSCLIIDAGTATTIDVLTADKRHCGGWILPGVDTMFTSVLVSTEKVDGNKNKASITFADNTSDNLNNACWLATIGAIKEGCIQAEKQGVNIDKIVLTGGNAAALSQQLSLPHDVEPALVFMGLSLYQ